LCKDFEDFQTILKGRKKDLAEEAEKKRLKSISLLIFVNTYKVEKRPCRV